MIQCHTVNDFELIFFSPKLLPHFAERSECNTRRLEHEWDVERRRRS